MSFRMPSTNAWLFPTPQPCRNIFVSRSTIPLENVSKLSLSMCVLICSTVARFESGDTFTLRPVHWLPCDTRLITPQGNPFVGAFVFKYSFTLVNVLQLVTT